MDEPLRATIVMPTAEQAAEKLADLETCLPYWKANPGLLIVRPDRLIVTVAGSAHDHMGFTLRLAVQEILSAPAGFDQKEIIEVGCVWNQPYMSFSRSRITASYCFYLHFGSEGVARARELYKASADGSEIPLYLLTKGFK